jgi:ArsR family transcriptional regulator
MRMRAYSPAAVAAAFSSSSRPIWPSESRCAAMPEPLGDPVRLRVLSMLAAAPEGEICVREFIQPIGKSQGIISHHLKILGEAGLVHGDRRGKWVWYCLDRDRLASLRQALDA